MRANPFSTEVPRPLKTAPPQDLTAGLSLGPDGGPRGGGVSYERGIPVSVPRGTIFGCRKLVPHPAGYNRSGSSDRGCTERAGESLVHHRTLHPVDARRQHRLRARMGGISVSGFVCELASLPSKKTAYRGAQRLTQEKRGICGHPSVASQSRNAVLAHSPGPVEGAMGGRPLPRWREGPRSRFAAGRRGCTRWHPPTASRGSCPSLLATPLEGAAQTPPR